MAELIYEELKKIMPVYQYLPYKNNNKSFFSVCMHNSFMTMMRPRVVRVNNNGFIIVTYGY